MAINAAFSFKLLISFSILLTVLPIGAFFFFFYGYFDGILNVFFDTSEFTLSARGMSSGILAVIVVNLVVAAFVCVAFNESEPTTEKSADEKKED
ncbi:hypothetical protein BSKO_01829 [Bryopsis sp. KO-2023]|nr:hypothetical protein BSKO_01829 [Bryopsis sp. KO-2023]